MYQLKDLMLVYEWVMKKKKSYSSGVQAHNLLLRMQAVYQLRKRSNSTKSRLT